MQLGVPGSARVGEAVARRDLALEIGERRLRREGALASIETTPPTAGSVLFGRVIGGTALVLGLVTVFLILYGLFTG